VLGGRWGEKVARTAERVGAPRAWGAWERSWRCPLHTLTLPLTLSLTLTLTLPLPLLALVSTNLAHHDTRVERKGGVAGAPLQVTSECSSSKQVQVPVVRQSLWERPRQQRWEQGQEMGCKLWSGASVGSLWSRPDSLNTC